MKNAKQSAPPEVTKTGSGPPRNDGHTEARLEFGKSDRGHHYRLHYYPLPHHYPQRRSEDVPPWSRAFNTEKAAQAAGRAAQENIVGDWPRPRHDLPLTPRGEHARLLDQAASIRAWVSGTAPSAADARHDAGLKGTARAYIREAAEVRESGRLQSWHSQARDRDVDRAPGRAVEPAHGAERTRGRGMERDR